MLRNPRVLEGLGAQRELAFSWRFSLALIAIAGLSLGAEASTSAAQPLGPSVLLRPDTLINATMLHDSLLDNYRKSFPPPGKTTVAVQLLLMTIVEVSTAKQTMEVLGWWRHYWNDPRLTWDRDFWQVDKLVLDKDSVWLPDVYVYETINQEILGSPSITAQYDGNISYSVPRKVTVACEMALATFPFDTQTCRFKLGSMSLDSSVVEVIPRTVNHDDFWEPQQDLDPPSISAVDLEQFRGNTEFALPKITVVLRDQKFQCCDHDFTLIDYHFHLDRQTATFISGILVPLVIVTAVGFTILIMPAPLSGARPGISLSVLFTTSAIYLVAAGKLPEIGNLTLIGRLYIASLVSSLMMTFISILSSSINMVVAEDNSNRADLLAVFRHYDADRSGYLDQQETALALSALGLTWSEREKLLIETKMDKFREFTLDDWVKLGTESRKLRPTVQHSVVVNGILKLLKKSWRRKKKIAPSESTKRKILFLGMMRASENHNQAQAQRDPTDELAEKAASGSHLSHLIQGPLMSESMKRKISASASEPSVDTAEDSLDGEVTAEGRNFGAPSESGGEEEPYSHHTTNPSGAGPRVLNGDAQTFIESATPERTASEPVLSRPAPPQHPRAAARLAPPSGYQNRELLPPIGSEGRNAGEKLGAWLDALGLQSEVKESFSNNGIDIEALSGLTLDKVEALGVKKMGDQSKLISWAKAEQQSHDITRRLSLSASHGQGDQQAQYNRPGKIKSKVSDGLHNLADAFHMPHMPHVPIVNPAKARFYGNGNTRSVIQKATKPSPKGHPPKDKDHANTPDMKKHLGAWIDFISLCIFPTVFFLYVLLEFTGLFVKMVGYSGDNFSWDTTPSDQVRTLVQLVDQRTGGQCFKGYQRMLSNALTECIIP